MKEYIDRAMSFAEYAKLIDDLLIEGKTTGPVQSESMFGYAKLNRRRMFRVEKTVKLTSSIVTALRNIKIPMVWLIITEGWCGDAAQNIPVIEKIAGESDKIQTRYLLRDENPGLIDQYLTDGARSIPKLIALEKSKLEVLGTWGARPVNAQRLFEKLKAAGTHKSIIQEETQRWYNNDKGVSMQREFEALIGEWAIDKKAFAAA